MVAFASLILALLGATSALAQLTCGPTPNSTSLPQNALLYLSVRANGTIDYVCGANNQTSSFREQATVSNDGYTGRLFVNSKNELQIDVGVMSNTTHKFVNNSVILNPNPITAPSPDAFAIPYARWTANATTGAPTPAGLPPIAFVTRIDTVGGVPHSCPALSSGTTPYQATYNLYTCDPAYLGPASPPNGSSPVPPSTSSPVMGFNPIPAPVSTSPSPPPSPAAPSLNVTSPPHRAPSPPPPNSGRQATVSGLVGIVTAMVTIIFAI